MLAVDFGALPPEVNSGLMYTGPGSGSMLAAAAAWDGVAAVLDSAAAVYGSVIAGLTLDSWLGPASASMAAAAAPYAGWLGAATALAQQTATQARTAAAAYEAAFGATVPPPLIAANRVQLTSLAATNILGLNSPAIEALQAEYAEMWAQDAATMFGYAATSETASTLAPFTQPWHVTDPGGAETQASAVAAAAGSAAATNVQAALEQLAAAVPQTLQALTASNPLASALSAQPAQGIVIPTPIGELDAIALYIATISTISLGAGITNATVNTSRPWNVGGGSNTTNNDQGPDQRDQPGSDTGAMLSAPAPGWGAGPAAAGVSQAAMVGALSVPHSWTMQAPEIKLAVESLPSSSVGAAPTDLGGAPAGLLSGMALAGLAGRGIAGAGTPSSSAAAEEEDRESQRKPTVVVIQKPPPATGPPGSRPL